MLFWKQSLASSFSVKLFLFVWLVKYLQNRTDICLRNAVSSSQNITSGNQHPTANKRHRRTSSSKQRRHPRPTMSPAHSTFGNSCLQLSFVYLAAGSWYRHFWAYTTSCEKLRSVGNSNTSTLVGTKEKARLRVQYKSDLTSLWVVRANFLYDLITWWCLSFWWNTTNSNCFSVSTK